MLRVSETEKDSALNCLFNETKTVILLYLIVLETVYTYVSFSTVDVHVVAFL